MLPVTKQDLQRLIREGKTAGKDVSGLQAELKAGIRKPVVGGGTLKINETTMIFSTGPARVEDFEGLRVSRVSRKENK